MKKPLIGTLMLLVSECFILQAQQVSMFERPLVIPTYPLGQPEINPIFYTPTDYQGAQNRVYPYPNLDRLSDSKTDKTYKGLFLENEYISICVLPELGGRLYIAKDKTNGYDFFYHNHVIKPSLIGMAGAWISGGIEWNIPHHHRVSTFMPVDYRMVVNPDSSKTIWVGEYEKRHSTKWAVGLTLHPGKSYIETTIRYFNVTPQITSLLIWANPAVHANENYQVIFPPDVEYAVYHAKTQFTTWPVADQFYQGIDFTGDVDLSWWKNTSSPTSFFQWGSEQNFVAGIDHAKQAGTVLIGDRFTCPGKKMWNWGNNAVARLWDQILTDNDGPYIELMASAFSDNQPDYSWCDPYSAKWATHFYYPVKGLSGIKEANKDAALNVELQESQAHIELNVTAVHPNLHLQVYRNDSLIFQQAADCKPDRAFILEVPLKGNPLPTGIRVRVIDEDGQELIAYQPKPKKNLPVPETYQPPAQPGEIATVDELCQAGLRLEQFHNAHLNPLPYYEEALRRDPKSIEANTQMGIHCLKNYEFSTAETYLRTATGVVTANHTRAKNTEPLYYLGLVLYHQGKFKEAYEWLQKASWSHAFASPAFYLCAVIDCRNRDYERAVENLSRSYREDNLNIETQNLLTILLRKTGKYNEALSQADAALLTDPFNFIALYEKSKLLERNPDHTPLLPYKQDFIMALRDEPDNYLETAFRYTTAGFFEDALEILMLAAGSKNTRLTSYPMIHYAIAYCLLGTNDSASALISLQKASSFSTDYCFPYGLDQLALLSKALELNSGDAAAWYYLGNIYADYQPDKAMECWESAVRLSPGMAIAWRNLACLYAHEKDDMPKSLEYINKALQLNPSDPQYLVEADMYYGYAGIPPEKRLELFEDHRDVVGITDATTVKYNNLLVWTGRYPEAIKSLKTRNIHAYERFNTNYHVTWVDAHVLEGIRLLEKKKIKEAIPFFEAALTFPRNLEIAEDSKAGIALYYLGLAWKMLGEAEKAKEYFMQSSSGSADSRWAGNDWPEVIFSRALAFRELGNKAQAEQIFRNLLTDADKVLNITPNPVAYSEGVENRWDKRIQKAKAYYMMALGDLGLGNKTTADEMFAKALTIEPSFLSAKSYKFSRGM
jgi:tetratricopeptide (TPR) repeat protein